jgi:hypothetical protein
VIIKSSYLLGYCAKHRNYVAVETVLPALKKAFRYHQKEIVYKRMLVYSQQRLMSAIFGKASKKLVFQHTLGPMTAVIII